MTSLPVNSAREQLLRALADGVPVRLIGEPAPADNAGVRHSAVLILFGALDQVPSSADAVNLVHADLDLLLTRRSDTMRYHPGQIAFPGGGVEDGDDSMAVTALREAQEETGLDPDGVEILGELPPFYISVSNNLVTPVIGWWRSPSPVAAADSESIAVFRVPVTELLQPEARGRFVLTRTRSSAARAAVFRGDAFELADRFEGRVIWGFTGMLLSALFAALKWEQPWDTTREFVIPPTHPNQQVKPE